LYKLAQDILRVTDSLKDEMGLIRDRLSSEERKAE